MAIIETENQASIFLNALHGGIDKGFITIWTDKKQTHWFPVNELEKASLTALELSKTSNVYVGVGARKEELTEYQRGTSKDVLYLPGVWVEIDIKGGKHSKENLPDKQAAEMILNTFSLEPSIIVHSGGGLHCYWLFDKPVRILTDKERVSADRMLKRFQSMFIGLAKIKSLHIDNTSDLARVLRVPGTYNLKEQPKPVEVIKMTDTRYSLIELKEAIEELETKTPKNQIEHKKRTEPSDVELPDANFEPIKNECLFLKSYMDHKETASYSEWVAAGSIVSYCEDGLEIFNEISKGYPTYNEQEIERKYNEIRSKMKPRTCSSLNQEFGECAGCKHFNKINSPIAVGMRNTDNFQIHLLVDKPQFKMCFSGKDFEISPGIKKYESGIDLYEKWRVYAERANDWRARLEYIINDKKDTATVAKNARNVELILRNELMDSLALDEFSNKRMITGPIPWRKTVEEMDEWKNQGNVEDSQLCHWLAVNWNIKDKETIFNALTHLLQEKTFHPVKEFIESVEWDGEIRVPTFFCDYLGAEHSTYTWEVTKRWFTGAVKRIYEPGCKFEIMPVLTGIKGIGKSYLSSKLANDKWFTDSLRSVEPKVAGEILSDVWICEIAELTALKNATADDIKAFISSSNDRFRGAYDRGNASEHKRHSVFIGTTNKATFISDETGERRQMPIKCHATKETTKAYGITSETVAQIWAEAKVYYDQGYLTYIDNELQDLAEVIHEQYKDVDPLEGEIDEYVKNHGTVCVRQIWDDIMTDDKKKKPTRKDSDRIVRILTSLGYEEMGSKRIEGYGKQRIYGTRN